MRRISIDLGIFVKFWILLVLICFLSQCQALGQEQDEVFVPDNPGAASFDQIFLFDSKTWLGWRVQKDGPYGGGRFTIEDGAICSDPAHPGLVLTTGQFADIALDFEMQAAPESDVFLLLRTSPSPKNLATSCYAIVLAASSAHPDRNICTFQGRRLANFRTEDAPPDPASADGSIPWKRFTVFADEKAVRVNCGAFFNNESFDEESVRLGFIGFLVTKGKVRFKNITWIPTRSLPMISTADRNMIFWNLPEEGSTFSIASRIPDVVLQGGPGMIETKRSYGNFIIRAEFNAVGNETKGDIFFRCLPDKAFSGYRCVIDNQPGPKNESPDVLNERIGGLYGLRDARNVGAKNDKWNMIVVKVIDNHIQTWVNGVQTIDYFDRRTVDETNDAQKGLRLQEGTIQIGTRSFGSRLMFRNIEIAPIPKRWISREEEKRMIEERARMFTPPKSIVDVTVE